KGSGAGYGFPRISECGAAIEEAAIAGDLGAIRGQASVLAGYLEQVEVAYE
ncbi:MAG: Hpt domain-containing protein, partial [Candidatus Solibacter usitatus]|nr:Hpt domain-containing protein [Candidatus Solibacter usitatus]